MSEFVAGSTVHDRYLLQARLVDQSHAGRTVWSGRDTLLDRPVHIYVIESDVEQHLDRARAASQFTVPHIAKIYAIETVEGVGLIVTEAPNGISVEALYDGSPADVEQARAIVGTAAEALAEAAKHGIYHEELSAESIVLTSQGIVVTGLGIASGDLPPEQRTDTARSHEDAIGLLRVFYLLVTGYPASPQAPDLPEEAELDSAITHAVHTALRSPEAAPPSSQLVAQLMMPWAEIEPLAQSLADTNKPVVEDPAPFAQVIPTDVDRKSVLKKAPARPSVKRTSVKGEAAALGAAASAGVAGAGAAASATGNAVTGGAAIFPSLYGAGAAAIPPPAAPVRTSIRSPQSRTSAPSVASAPVAPSVPAQAVTSAGGASSAPNASSSSGETEADLAKYRLPPVSGYGPPPAPTGVAAIRDPFNLTPWIIVIFLVALFFFGKWAIDLASTPIHHGAPVPSQPTTPPAPIATTPSTQAPEEGETDAGGSSGALQLPSIQRGTQLDPDGDGDEHPEAVDRAWDGDTSTYWFTRTYVDPTMGAKSGVGYHVQFTERSYFNSITLNTNSQGGMVEIRATTAADPTGGQLLQSGPLNGTTTFQLSTPAATDQIVLWWTELPVSGGDLNRIELNEISFS